MASSVPLAAANPQTPLSYAERAKKAQNTRTQSAQQRPTAPSTSTIIQANANNSAARSAPISSPPPISKVSSTRSTTADARIPPTPTQASIVAPKSPTPSSAKPPVDSKTNGDVTNHTDSPTTAPSTTPAQKQASAPPVNVWTKRKEQMAARAVSQSRSPTTISQPTAASLLSSPPPADVDAAAPSTTTANSSTSGVKTSPSVPPPPTTNGHLAPSTHFDDPFVVKPGRSPSSLNISPPAIDDAESWPEVGQAVSTPPNDRKEGREEDEKGHEREPSQGHGAKRSEKTKWVPVPPEELQFEGPARPPHTRQRSNNPDRNHRSGPSAAASSSSGQGSQQQSRTHSVTGRRPTPSYTGSQTQSRTGSVQSSPRHPSIRGAGRRLPDDSAPVFGTTRSIRSSRTNSPATYAQPQPLPVPEFIPGVRPYVNTNVTQGGPAPLSAVPDSAAAELNPVPMYYTPHPPHFAVSPYHSPRPAGSPVNNPYALPPMSFPGQPAPVPMPGYGTPPYPIYPSYGYPYGQPYMYWPQPGVPPQGINMAHLQPADGVPPPTLMARPPPPSESDAVAGYRDIVFSLPTESDRQEQGEERPARLRELSFGSIDTVLEGTSNSTGLSPASPHLVTAQEGAALGLDVNGGHPGTDRGRALIQSSQEPLSESKSFPVFSIGIAPGEAGPPRLRARTRTQSRGAATSVSAPELAQPSEQLEAPAEDPVAALAEVAAKVIDLTDSETKWEFGTTKLEEDASASATEVSVTSVGEVSNVDSAPAAVHAPPFVPMMSHYASAPPFVPPVTIPGAAVNGVPSAPPSAYGPRQPHSATEDEWEVRDYGFGFGRGGPPPVYPQAAAPPQDRPYQRRDYQHGDREHSHGRPRRGSYSQGGYGYERGGERGAYGGRRGRGLSGGYGGRGYRDRSFSGRGGYSGPNQRQQAYAPPSQTPSEITYYAPPVTPLATYIPQPYEYSYVPYAPPPPPAQIASPQGAPPPPMPVPLSNVGFPLDSTRYYLLGQLEYYLSAQNLAQDFFLRQQMDSRGWIPISLFASFNRVRTLTIDMQLITDVLTLSSLAEVRGAHVRIHQWQQFVLPTAAPSMVEEEGASSQGDASTSGDGYHPAASAELHHGEHHLGSQNHEGEDDEEEDVVFVM